MERQKYIIITLIIITLPFYGMNTYCQNLNHSSRRQVVYDAYVNGTIEEWLPVMESLQNIPTPDLDENLELLSYYYGFTGYLLGSNDNKTAKIYIEKGNKLADEILEKESENATALAYKGSFISFKIALSKFKAIGLGPESMRYINKAYKTDSLNVQAIADKANMLFYAPGIFGGNKKQALTYFERAIKRLEDNNETKGNWFYLNLMTMLAQHYKDAGQEEKSKTMYGKILDFEPSFKWAQEEIATKN